MKIVEQKPIRLGPAPASTYPIYTAWSDIKAALTKAGTDTSQALRATKDDFELA
jgi:hypothetical protein